MKDGLLGDDCPYFLGHEGSDIIESVGDGVTNVRPGHYVMVAAGR